MKHTVITIARHYGSGGKTIGEMFAKDLGINCYNREILRMASDDSGINERFFNQADEKLQKTSLFKIAKNIYKGELLSPDSHDFTSTDNLFNYQAKIIKELAAKESCVLIGRCADFVLKDYPSAIRVFVHASEEFCLERSMERHSMSEREMEKFIQREDKVRGDFYKYHTGHEWNDARNYDLCLDSSKLGFEKCLEAIKAYVKIRTGQEGGLPNAL